MPAHLKTSEIEELREKLESRRAELVEKLRDEVGSSDAENYTEVVGQTRDMGDDAAADLLIDTHLAGVEREVEELEAIRDALGRMEVDEYGLCIDCDAPIAVERLRVLPTAERGIECQNQWEREHEVLQRSEL